MGLLERVLVEGEEIRGEVRFGGVRVVVTDRGVFVEGGGRVTVVPPAHVHGLSLGYALAELVAGLVFIIFLAPLALYLLHGSLGTAAAAGLALIGLILAVYGALYRYRLSIHYTGGRVEVRGGGGLIEAVKHLRRLLARQAS